MTQYRGRSLLLKGYGFTPEVHAEVNSASSVTALRSKLLALQALSLSSWEPVNTVMAKQWCEVLGFHRSRYTPSVSIPETMLHSWTMPGMAGCYPEGQHTDLLRTASDRFADYGFCGVMAVQLQQTYDRPLNVEENLRREISLESISPPKQTAVGAGYFVTEKSEVFSANERVGTTRLVLFVFEPKQEARVIPLKEPPFPATRPILKLDLTHRFVVAASIATRDYEDVHLDPPAARRRGADDIYLNIMTTLGLFQRAKEELVSPEVCISAAQLRLFKPAYPGETLRFYPLEKHSSSVRIEARIGEYRHAVCEFTLKTN